MFGTNQSHNYRSENSDGSISECFNCISKVGDRMEVWNMLLYSSEVNFYHLLCGIRRYSDCPIELN